MQVRKHKQDLIKTTQNVIEEMETELSYSRFTSDITDQIAKSHDYERLKEEERVLTQEIQETTSKLKKHQNDYSREQDENSKEMTELKRQKNEAQVEKELNIQYSERQIQGQQSCEDRLHKKKETELQKEIDRMKAVLTTEQEVNAAVEVHLRERVDLLIGKYKEQDSKRESEVTNIENEKTDIRERKQKATEEIQEIVEKIKLDAAERAKRDEEMMAENESKEAKVREKMSMEDAARYIQRRWTWFQTEGKFLAKKGKKGRKGKKKKKK